MDDKHLFSKPILSSDDNFSNDDTLDTNGVNFDPNTESMLTDEEPEATKTVNVPKIDESQLFKTEPLDTKANLNTDQIFQKETSQRNTDQIFQKEPDHYDTEQLFKSEPVKQESKQPVRQKPTQQPVRSAVTAPGVYSDKPKSNNRKIIIISIIAAVAIICIAWFAISVFSSSPKVEDIEDNVVIEEDIENSKESDITTPNKGNQNQNQNNYNNNNSYNNSTNEEPDEPDYETPDTSDTDQGTNEGGSSNEDNTGSDSGSSDSNTYEGLPPVDESQIITD